MRIVDRNDAVAGELAAAQEAAVLHSAGFTAAAIEVLHARIEGGEADRREWVMLLELCHVEGRRDEFDAWLATYRSRFPGARHPEWGYPAPIEAPGTFPLKGLVGAKEANLDEITAFVRSRRAAAIDMGEVHRIDFDFVARLSTLMREFHMAGRRVILANIAEIHATLLEAFGIDSCVALMRRTALAQPVEDRLAA